MGYAKKKGKRKSKKGKTIKLLKQTGKSKLGADRKRKALPPGRRISKKGKKYTETRRNRSDKKGKRV